MVKTENKFKKRKDNLNTQFMRAKNHKVSSHVNKTRKRIYNFIKLTQKFLQISEQKCNENCINFRNDTNMFIEKTLQ